MQAFPCSAHQPLQKCDCCLFSNRVQILCEKAEQIKVPSEMDSSAEQIPSSALLVADCAAGDNTRLNRDNANYFSLPDTVEILNLSVYLTIYRLLHFASCFLRSNA